MWEVEVRAVSIKLLDYGFINCKNIGAFYWIRDNEGEPC